MPRRKPQILKVTIALAETSAGLPSACMACAHEFRRTTPFVTYSTRLITTPASRPPRTTRSRLVWLIASSFELTAVIMHPLWADGKDQCHRASLISSMCTCSYTVFPREKIGLSLATEAKRLTLGARGFDQEVRGVGFRSWFILLCRAVQL